MVGLFCLIFLALAIFCIVQIIRDKWDCAPELPALGLLIFAILFIIFAIWSFVLANRIGTGYTIDDKIAMYEEENASIEKSIDTIVKNYMEFETSTYEKFKDEDAMNVISLFPELKSDALVQKQIEIYAANNNRIKELKEEKISLSKAKWQLYFGR